MICGINRIGHPLPVDVFATGNDLYVGWRDIADAVIGTMPPERGTCERSKPLVRKRGTGRHATEKVTAGRFKLSRETDVIHVIPEEVDYMRKSRILATPRRQRRSHVLIWKQTRAWRSKPAIRTEAPQNSLDWGILLLSCVVVNDRKGNRSKRQSRRWCSLE